MKYPDRSVYSLSKLSSSFKKLDTFTLQITQDDETIKKFIDTLPSLPHLKSLDILLSSLSILSKTPDQANYIIDPPQIFRQLRHLSLTIIEENPYNFPFQALDLSNLQSFQLATQLISLKKNNEIFKGISTIKDLKTLDISITNASEIGQLLKSFFNNIAKLEKLTSLKVFFSGSVIEEIPSGILIPLKEIFQKPIKIEDFALECNELLISTNFSELLKIFSESASSFRRFKLKTIPATLESNQMKPLLKLFEGLANIQVLKLPCLNINSDQQLTRITTMALKLKEISSFCLGKMGDKINGGTFIENVKRVIEKRGVCSFECETTQELKRVLLRIPLAGSISFEKTTKKNPSLKSLSKDLLILMNFNDSS